MSLDSSLHLIAPVMQALDLQQAEGLHLCSADSLRALHHPLFHPDAAALIFWPQAADLPAIRRVLLNQYPPEHPVRLVRQAGQNAAAGDAWTVVTLPLSALGEEPQVGTWTALAVPPLDQASSFERFQEIIAHLRAPEGCPWDRKQTHASLRPYLLEETYEVLDALDSGEGEALREELGDLLLQIVLHSQIAVDSGEFRMADVLAAINAKIIRRHPHVWGEVQVNDEQDVKVNWDRLKQAEKNGQAAQPVSRLDGVSRSLPALSQAFSYQDRAARVGFDWPTIEPVIDKLHEELAELFAALDEPARALEMGDVLFVAVNLARWLKVDPESALRDANARFYRRFYYIERQAAGQGRDLQTLSLDEMDALWDEAKANGL